jgi:hypothetical protein
VRPLAPDSGAGLLRRYDTQRSRRQRAAAWGNPPQPDCTAENEQQNQRYSILVSDPYSPPFRVSSTGKVVSQSHRTFKEMIFEGYLSIFV